MKIQLRAASLLGLHDHQHVSLSGLAEEMHLSRFQLSHFLDPTSPQISKSSLEAVCKYLVDHGRVRLDDMFQRLFAVEPESIWPLLASRQHLNFLVGVRKAKSGGFEQFVVAADAVLQSVMVNQLMGCAACQSVEAKAVAERHPRQVIDSQLVLSWGASGVPEAAVQQEAKRYVAQCVHGQSNSATVCVGSIKSNPACDPLLARGFRRARAFMSEDQSRRLADRSCPFFMMYRSDDPHPPSCWGGTRLAKDDAHTAPGIYYARPDGGWDCAPCGVQDDAALVYYYFHKARQNLMAVWAGYTGRSTRLLAEMLREGQAERFWPPAVDNAHASVGAFVVRFALRPRRKSDSLRLRPRGVRGEPEVIALSEEVLTPRVARLR
jgi:hypothetical protein